MIRSDFSVVCPPHYIYDGGALNHGRMNGACNGQRIITGEEYHSRMTSNICPGSGLAFGIAADRDAMVPRISITTTLHARPCPLHD